MIPAPRQAYAHPNVTPEQAIRDAQAGRVSPVYLVVGEERVLIDRVVAAVRSAALQGGVADFNQETLTAGEADVDRMLSAVRTVPMMAPRRFVLVRSVDRWDGATSKSKAKDKEKESSLQPMDKLATYASNPVDSACLMLLAAKLDRRRKLVTVAKKAGFLIECEPLTRNALPRFIEQEASQRGHAIAHDVADLLAEIAGPELSGVIDAVERLSLYVGEGAKITEDDVAACVTRIRPSSVWELVGAVARRDAATALSVLMDVYEPQDRGLRLVGVLAWSTRQLLRFALALRSGATPDQAAVTAGASPYKARELAGQVKNLNSAEIERWLRVLAETDLALKGSRRPSRAVLESAILTMTVGLPR